ncbi:hypothetical protein OESDEN_04405 [Oesophagostomum dentatum]|uniref:Uncharacterized protein n=1 Tax=Oesophagostomum dentatum TaxID=61180 RepID=A0A0B1TJV0_OESDE|nr:hypothetical protein OESDEN_04405 [Oesophagostomum dentatum]
MAAEAEATREAGAKVIAAEGEQKASQALREAAEVVCLSFSGKHRFFSMRNTITILANAQQHQVGSCQIPFVAEIIFFSAEKNSTIIFPFPIELIHNFFRSKSEKDL